MRERKALMMEMAEAFIALPGGFGTLEEISEVITQKQFGFIKAPLAAVNTAGFFDPLAAFFEKFYSLSFAKPALPRHLPVCGHTCGGHGLYHGLHAAASHQQVVLHEPAFLQEPPHLPRVLRRAASPVVVEETAGARAPARGLSLIRSTHSPSSPWLYR